jgi:RNA polymerase sigma-54 factor
LKQSQHLGIKQSQKLSPQQIQLMKLLQIPTATLDQRIKEELEVNPALEEGDEMDEMSDPQQDNLNMNDVNESYYGDAADGKSQKDEDFQQNESGDHDEAEASGDDEYYDEFESLDARGEEHESFELDDYLRDFIEEDPATYKTKGDAYNADDDDKSVPVAVENSFHESLIQQLGLLRLGDEDEEAIALQIIGSIDDDGYLRRDPKAIVDDLLFSQNVVTTEKMVLQMLYKVQRFDPPGIGARDLQECLIIQLRGWAVREGSKLSKAEIIILGHAVQIIEEFFEEFTKKHYARLQRQLDIEESELKKAIDLILKLNPKPASGHVNPSERTLNYIVPDFLIVNRDGDLELTLNGRNAPDLRINDQYKDMLSTFQDTKKIRKTTKPEKEAVLFIKQKIDSAKWFIDAIRQRQQTMMRSMNAIMMYQYDYFLSGDQKKIRPMILKDIAEVTGLDISTISRVANSKFVQTEFGTKRLKEFFSESLQTDEGEEVSTLEVKKILTDIIGEENKRRPLSDEKLKSMLLKRGYPIARRTVAKYREQLNVAVARLRREL